MSISLTVHDGTSFVRLGEMIDMRANVAQYPHRSPIFTAHGCDGTGENWGLTITGEESRLVEHLASVHSLIDWLCRYANALAEHIIRPDDSDNPSETVQAADSEVAATAEQAVA